MYDILFSSNIIRTLQTKMNKLHAISHMPRLGLVYGDLSQISCHGRESSHRLNVTEIFWNTSARRDSHPMDMNVKLMTSLLNDISSFAEQMQESASTTAANHEQRREHSPYIYEYNFFMRQQSELPERSLCPATATVRRPNGSTVLLLIDEYGYYKFPDGELVFHPLVSDLSERRLKSFCATHEDYRDFNRINMVSCVICVGSVNSSYKREILHCTQKLKGSGAAYSYIRTLNNKLGRVIAIYEVVKESGIHYLLDLALLRPGNRAKYRYIHWDVYEWDWNLHSNTVRTEIIPIEQLSDNVRIEACMDSPATVDSFSQEDCFIYLPRSFFERRSNTCFREAYIGIDLPTSQDARNWIKRRAACGVNIPRVTFPPTPQILEMIDPMIDLE
jgi:hypothetical protein